jgi:hypothetical protein
MTRQWRKEKQSDLAKPGFSLAYEQTQPLIFHTLCRGGVLLSLGSHVFFDLKPQITRGHIYIRQYTINGRTVSSVIAAQVQTSPGRGLLAKQVRDD